MTNPEKLVPKQAGIASQIAPVLNARQHNLLQRVWEIQTQFNLDHVWLGMQGWIGSKDLAPEKREALKEVNLKVEIVGGEPLTDEKERSPEYEDLINSMPELYLRRIPGHFGLVFSAFMPVAITDEGIRYLRRE